MLIAGTASGVGKTTVALALSAAWQRRGLTVQAFKGGPDFLDTTHHTRMSGRPARNLDTWLLPHATNRTLFAAATEDAGAAIVEGMMGLFDGKDGASEAGSSAEIARLLGLPVVLVVDASKSARSLAATVLGFESFDPTMPLAGVILNRVASARHLDLLRAAIESRCRTPILGALPRTPEITIPERHLGLHAAAIDRTHREGEIDTLAALAETHFDMARLTALTVPRPPCVPRTQAVAGEVRIGIAQDEAFSFYYEDNLDLLRGLGAVLVPFSPVHDRALPPDLDALYLGGGYPELHAEALAANHAMLAAVRSFAAAGAPVYAECGGMIYLGRTLRAPDATHTFAGLLPLEVEMTARLVDFGYATVTLTRDCMLGPAGTVVRGHGFHYSRLAETPDCETAFDVQLSLGRRNQPDGYVRGNILAGYTHLHFLANPEVARSLIDRIVQHRSRLSAAAG